VNVPLKTQPRKSSAARPTNKPTVLDSVRAEVHDWIQTVIVPTLVENFIKKKLSELESSNA
jgi:hypothetical protein